MPPLDAAWVKAVFFTAAAAGSRHPARQSCQQTFRRRARRSGRPCYLILSTALLLDEPRTGGRSQRQRVMQALSGVKHEPRNGDASVGRSRRLGRYLGYEWRD